MGLGIESRVQADRVHVIQTRVPVFLAVNVTTVVFNQWSIHRWGAGDVKGAAASAGGRTVASARAGPELFVRLLNPQGREWTLSVWRSSSHARGKGPMNPLWVCRKPKRGLLGHHPGRGLEHRVKTSGAHGAGVQTHCLVCGGGSGALRPAKSRMCGHGKPLGEKGE